MKKLIAIMGKAGSGKDSVAKTLCYKNPSFHYITSHTSRPIRDNEIQDKDYHFVTKEKFEEMILNNSFIELQVFNGWYYGLSKDELKEDKINVGVFAPMGMRSLMKQEDIDLTIYYLQASDKERLLRQLNREFNPNINEIIRRVSTDTIDFQILEDIPYISLSNETKADFNQCIKTIKGNIN